MAAELPELANVEALLDRYTFSKAERDQLEEYAGGARGCAGHATGLSWACDASAGHGPCPRTWLLLLLRTGLVTTLALRCRVHAVTRVPGQRGMEVWARLRAGVLWWPCAPCLLPTWPLPVHLLNHASTDLYAILKCTEKLERSYVRDAISARDYEPACRRLIAQYRTLWETVKGSVPSVTAFMASYGMQCPMAARRLVESGMPATVEHGRPGMAGESVNYTAAVADAVGAYITTMDALKLNMSAVDQVYPLLSDLTQSLNKVPAMGLLWTGWGDEYQGRALELRSKGGTGVPSRDADRVHREKDSAAALGGDGTLP